MTAVSGDDAKLWRVVRTDSFATVNNGELVSADDVSGHVVWTVQIDGQPERKEITLGADAIRIVRAGR